MPTNTAGSTARDYGKQMVHYLRKAITPANAGSPVVIGAIPANALILAPLSGVQVNAAFNAGTANTLDIGVGASGNLYGSGLALGNIAFVPIAQAVSRRMSGDTVITATVNLSGTAATAGEADVVIAYIPAY